MEEAYNNLKRDYDKLMREFTEYKNAHLIENDPEELSRLHLLDSTNKGLNNQVELLKDKNKYFIQENCKLESNVRLLKDIIVETMKNDEY